MPVFLSDILLPQDPDQDLEAATKQYVDANAGGGGGSGLAYSADTGAGTSIAITHNLGTKDVDVSVYKISDGLEVDVPFSRTSINVITLNSAVDLAGHRVVVLASGGTGAGSLAYRGAWSGTEPYVEGEVVTHAGGTYVCVTDTETATIDYSRNFDGDDDNMYMSLGAATNVTLGDTTTVAILRRTNTVSGGMRLICRHTDVDASQNTHLSFSSAQMTTGHNGSGAGGPNVALADGWVLVAIGKDSGSSEVPRFHKYVYSTDTWTHSDGDGAVIDGDIVIGTTGRFEIGSVEEYYENFNGDLQMVGIFPANLSDAEVEDLPLAINAWHALDPVVLWLFDQASTATAVTDLSAAGSADQTAIVGTTVSSSVPAGFGYGDAVPPADDSAHWDVLAAPAMVVSSTAPSSPAVGDVWIDTA